MSETENATPVVRPFDMDQLLISTGFVHGGLCRSDMRTYLISRGVPAGVLDELRENLDAMRKSMKGSL